MSASEEPPRRRGPRPLETREQAWEYLLLLLGRQSYTLAELRRKLERRGAADLADELLERLVELRLADDAAYSEQYVSSRRSARGRLALAQELWRRGVEADLVSSEVGKLTPAQQLAAAVGLLEKSAWRYKPATDTDLTDERTASEAKHRAKAKAFAFLARRGFDAETAAQALAGVGWFESGED
ncbi:MAG: RecX family transcriptional regulator [Trueperaceae bacterium]|nr:RecX family transcriptional regulator [Trueperaceae bacterium]